MKAKYLRKTIPLLICLALLGTSFLISHKPTALAAPLLQLTPFLTPTPGPDGRIVYVVQPNDTLLRISLISGVTIDELRGLNNLVGDNITVGQKLLLGLGGPSQVTPTPGPSPTPTIEVPTPTTVPGAGDICVLLYNDQNGDSIRQESEPSIPGSAISLTSRATNVSLTENTQAGSEPQCFKDLPEGEYSISVAVPEGYNPTTLTSYNVDLKAGDKTYLDFGAQPNSQNQAQQPILPAEGKRSPVLGILGGLFLVAGLGLALFAGRYLRGSK